MIFVSNKLTSKQVPDLDQQLAAYNNLTQSLSEEFDRASELQAQMLHTNWESWHEFLSDMGELKDPQELFLRVSAQAHAVSGQSQMYLHELVNLGQRIQEKFLALGQTVTPFSLDSVITVSPPATSSVSAKSETSEATRRNRVEIKDINHIEKTASSYPRVKKAKPTSNLKASNEKASTKASTIDVDAIIVADNTNVGSSTAPKKTPTPRVRNMKASSKAASTAIEQNNSPTTPVKKSAVVGLPSKPAPKTGFAGAAGQPEFKPKSSKATGAKKRVRQ